jgi:probable rRNA maturation factor
MIDVEVVGLVAELRALRARAGARTQQQLPDAAEVRVLAAAAAARAGVRDGHLAVEFVDAARIAALNAQHRAEPSATDVLSFPIDGAASRGDGLGETTAGVGEGELGDVVICIEHTRDVREAIVHGVLHLAGFDHETDDGEMLALQREVLAELAGDAPDARGEPSRPRARR